ncbi:MAG: hypothetical protein QF652_05740, partial [Dehalococcoidia bacterium]|nr:hypothetical protein [Dehalococcoidia bacterium]
DATGSGRAGVGESIILRTCYAVTKLGRSKIGHVSALAIHEILELVAGNPLLELHHAAGGNPQLSGVIAVDLQRVND